MKTFVIANQKGGVGKTTTATCLASILNARGKKTLLVDTDVQANSTDTFHAKIDNTATLYDLILDNHSCTVEEAIQHTPYGDIIASDPLIARADEMLVNSAGAYFRLREALAGLEGIYDYIIIDTNPAINTMLHNALVAADSIIVPITADRYALIGMAQLTSSIAEVKKYLNSRLMVEGLLLVKFNERILLARGVKTSLSQLAASMDTKVFNTYIRESVRCREAQAKRKPLIQYAPKCTTELDYENFVNELLMEEK